MTTKTTIQAQGSDKVRLEIQTVNFDGKHSSFAATTITVYKTVDGVEQSASFEIYSDSEIPVTTLPRREVKAT